MNIESEPSIPPPPPGALDAAGSVEARLRAEAQRVERDFAEFSAAASHTMREPLRSISNLAGFLIEDLAETLQERDLERLRAIKAHARRMDSLLEAARTYSNVAKTSMVIRAVSLRALAEQVAATHAASNVNILVDPALPDIRCDRTMMVFVLNELIRNGIRFNTAPVRSLRVESEPGEPGSVVIAVHDNGIGLTTEQQGNLFRLFRPLHAGESVGSGNGAGLAITRRMLHAHGGTLLCTSVVNHGSCFRIVLPTAGPLV